MAQLRLCLICRLNGVQQDESRRANDLIRRGSMLSHLPTIAAYVEIFRIQASPASNVSRDLVFLEPSTYKHDDASREGMWAAVDVLCNFDYVCPLTVFMVSLSYSLHIMHHDDKCFTDVMRQFLRRHGDLMDAFERAVSYPCFNPSCKSHYCAPGAACRCAMCGYSFCCGECIDKHTCSPGEHPWPFTQQRDEHPKSYLEHVLSMFGIVLPTRVPDDVVDDDDTCVNAQMSAQQLTEIMTKADGYASGSRHLPAIRLYTAAIDNLECFDKTSPLLLQLYAKRGISKQAIGDDLSSLDDFAAAKNGKYDQSRLDDAARTEQFKLTVKTASDMGLSITDNIAADFRDILARAERAMVESSTHPDDMALGSRAYAILNEMESQVMNLSDISKLVDEPERCKLVSLINECIPYLSRLDMLAHDQASSSSSTAMPSNARVSCKSAGARNKDISKIKHDYSLIPWNVLEHHRFDGCCVCCLEAKDLDGQNAVVFKCKHALCSKCLCHMVKKSRDKSDVITSLSCPMCRAELPSNILTVVAKQFIVDDKQAPELQSLAQSMHLRKPDEVCVSLMSKNDLDVTSTYNALFMMTRMMTKVDKRIVQNVLEQSRIVEKLDAQFHSMLDTSTDAFIKLKDNLKTSKATLQDTISQAIRDSNCQPAYNNGALTCSVKGFDIDACTSALTSVILPILPVYGRTSINDIDCAIKQKFTDAIPPHVRHETRDGVMILKSNN